MKEEKSNWMGILLAFNFAMLLFITIAQEPIQKAVDTITRNFEKEGLIKICKGLDTRRDMIYHELFDTISLTCVVSYVDARVDGDVNSMKAQGLLKHLNDDDIVHLRVQLKEHYDSQSDVVTDYCENGIKKEVILYRANLALQDHYDFFHCKELLDE